jgi:hypothetical protein
MPYRSRTLAVARHSAHRLSVNASVATALILGWAAASLAAFAVADAGGVMELPIGALFAGQGGLIALVLIGVRIRDQRR